MKRKGYMLIEVIVTLTIFFTLILVGVKGINAYKKYMLSIKAKDFIYEINTMFNYGKKFCFRKSENGSIVLSQKGDHIELMFLCGNKIIKKCNTGYGLNLEIKFKGNITNRIEEKIKKSGYIESNTIYFISNNKVKYKLVIRPAATSLKVEEILE